MTLAVKVTPGLRDHIDQHVQGGSELRLTLMRGYQLTTMSVTIPEGELFRDTGHTIEAAKGEHLVDGVGLESAGNGYTLRTWPHDPIPLVGPVGEREPDTITYVFGLEVAP